jgi:hypothetical protein
MTTTEVRTYSIQISHRDGSFWARPGSSIEEGLLNGMVMASAWSTRFKGANVAWTEITDRFVKGEVVGSGERMVVMWGDLPMAAEDALIEWIFANDDE